MNNKVIVSVFLLFALLFIFFKTEVLELLNSHERTDVDLIACRKNIFTQNNVSESDLAMVVWSDQISYKSGKYGDPTYTFKFLYSGDCIITAKYDILANKKTTLKQVSLSKIASLDRSGQKLKGAKYIEQNLLSEEDFQELLVLEVKESKPRNIFKITKKNLNKL